MFKILSSDVLELKDRIRQENDLTLRDILDDIEEGQPCKKTIDELIKLKFTSLPQHEQDEIKKNATYIFATNVDKNIHNSEQLLRICNVENPLACLKAQHVNPHKKFCRSHFDISSTPLETQICVGARVAIKGKNIKPTWGLFNGAIGTVREIVFQEDKNPNLGDLPLYVAVEMLSYKPPKGTVPFDSSNPNVSDVFMN